jgi:hypothetical protein
MGEMLQVGAFAYVAYNFGLKGKGVSETFTDTRKVLGKWTAQITGEKKPAVSFGLST